MKKQVFLRYPYTPLTFIKTARKDGLVHAFREDLAMTKRDIEDNVMQYAFYSLFAIALVATPIVLGVYAIKERKPRGDILQPSSLENM